MPGTLTARKDDDWRSRTTHSDAGGGLLVKSADRQDSAVDLGVSAVATLHLEGFRAIADLMGPVASLALHRKIGAVLDGVCASYGAVRVRGEPGVFRIAWFCDSTENDAAHDNSANAAGGQRMGARESGENTA